MMDALQITRLMLWFVSTSFIYQLLADRIDTYVCGAGEEGDRAFREAFE